MPKDLTGLTPEEYRVYLEGPQENSEEFSFKNALSAAGDFIEGAWAAGVNRAGTTYDWIVGNNPDGVGYTFDYNTALQLQDRKNKLDQIDTSILTTNQLAEYLKEKNNITSNFKALLTDGTAYDEKQMDRFLNTYRESRGYSLLKDYAEEQAAKKPSRQQVLEKIAMEELRSNVYKNLNYVDHTVTQSDGTKITYNAQDLPIIMDVVIKNHQRTFEGAIKALAFYQNMNDSDLTDEDRKVKKDAENHIKNISRYMADYINNLETSTSVGSADFAAEWMARTGSDNPFTVTNGFGQESNNELYFERQLNKRRITNNPLNLLEYVEAASNIMYEVGDNAMTGLKMLTTLPFKGLDEAVKDAQTLHDSEQVTNTELALKKETNFMSVMSNWLLDAGPDIAMFLLANKGVGAVAEGATSLLTVERLSAGFQTASRVIRAAGKIRMDKIDEAILALDSVSPAAKAFSSITSFIVRETIENAGAQMLISGGTMENYNNTDLALDVGFSMLFGGVATAAKVKNSIALLEQDKSMFRAMVGKDVYGISDELWSQIDDQTKLAIGDTILTFIKNETVSPRVNDLVAKAKATYQDVNDFVSQVKLVAESRLQEVLAYASTLKKYSNIIEKDIDGNFSIAKDAPAGTYIALNEEYVNKVFLEEQGKKSRTAAAMSAFYLNKEKGLLERIKKAREAWDNYSIEKKEETLEARKFVIEKNPVMKTIFDKWIEDTGRDYPETNEQWVERLEEFSFDAGRLEKEYNAIGTEFRNQVIKSDTEESIIKYTHPKKAAINNSRIADVFERYKKGDVDRTTMLRVIPQGYDFAVKFFTGLSVNGPDYFKAVMDSNINAAAKIAALDPARDMGIRKMNIVNLKTFEGKIEGFNPMFSNPIEVAYFLGKEGEVKINNKEYPYTVDLINGTISIDGGEPLDLYKGNNNKILIEGTSGNAHLEFIKKEKSTIDNSITVNNTVTSVFATKTSYSNAKKINSDIGKIKENIYNKIQKLDTSAINKAKIFQEFVESPPKFNQEVYNYGKSGNLYMSDSDYGFKNDLTMQIYWGKTGEVSTRGFNIDKAWGKEKTYLYELDPSANKYLLKDPETNKVVGWADKTEIFIDGETFKGDVMLSPNKDKLKSFDNTINVIKSFLGGESTEETVKAFKAFTGAEPPTKKADVENLIVNAFYSHYNGKVPEGLEAKDIKALMNLNPSDLERLISISHSYGLDAEGVRVAYEVLNKKAGQLNKFIESSSNLFKNANEAFYNYIALKYPGKVKVNEEGLKKFVDMVSTKYSDLLPESFAEAFGKHLGSEARERLIQKLDEVGGDIFHASIVDMIKPFIQDKKDVYERYISALMAERTAAYSELKEVLGNIGLKSKGDSNIIKEVIDGYDQLIKDVQKFHEVYFTKTEELPVVENPIVEEIRLALPDKRSESVLDEIDAKIAEENVKAPEKPKQEVIEPEPIKEEQPNPEPQPDVTPNQIDDAVKELSTDEDYVEQIENIKVEIDKNASREENVDRLFEKYLERLDSTVKNTESELSEADIFETDYTRKAAQKKATWYNKEIFNPEKHIGFLPPSHADAIEKDYIIKNNAPKDLTLGEVFNSIRTFVNNNRNNFIIVDEGALDALEAIYDGFLDKTVRSIRETPGRGETWMNLKRSLLDLYRISMLITLNSKGQNVDNLILPRVSSHNNLLKRYYELWGFPEKGVITLSRTGSLFGTYSYGHATDYLIHRVYGDAFNKVNVLGLNTFRIADGYEAEKAIPKIHRFVNVIGQLYKTLPYQIKQDLIKKLGNGKLDLKEINNYIFSKNVEELQLLKTDGGYSVMGEKISENEYLAYLNTIQETARFFNLTDTLTTARMLKEGSGGSVLGVLNNNIKKVKQFKSLNDFVNSLGGKHDPEFVFIKEHNLNIGERAQAAIEKNVDSELQNMSISEDSRAGLLDSLQSNDYELIGLMDAFGWELISLKGYDAHLLNPFGFLFRKKVSVKDIDEVNLIEDVARTKTDVNIDHDIGVKEISIPKTQAEIEYADNNFDVEPSDFDPKPRSEDLIKFKSREKWYANPPQTRKEEYSSDRRKAVRKKDLHDVVNPDGTVNGLKLMHYQQKYGPVKIDPEDTKYSIKVMLKTTPWHSPATDSLFKMFLFERLGVDARALNIEDGYRGGINRVFFMPEHVKGNWEINKDLLKQDTDAFKEFFISPLKDDDTIKDYNASGQEKLDTLINSLDGNEDPFAAMLKQRFENIKEDLKESPFSKESRYEDMFYPSTQKKTMEDAFRNFEKFNEGVTYSIKPDMYNDETLKEALSSVGNGMILVNHTDNAEKYFEVYKDLYAAGYEPIINDTILGELMIMNGVYFQKRQAVKDEIAKKMTQRAQNIGDASGNALGSCN